MSNAKAAYGYKGDAAKIQAKLDEAKKNDLRRNHFVIGGNSANVTATSNSTVFRPMSAKQRVESKPALN
jgi:hypothetical protein